jgi:Ssp1 endopeptidase immunity protein Rap1a
MAHFVGAACKVGIAVFGLVLSFPTHAQISVSTVSGGYLVEACRRDRGLEANFCAGYVLGAADALQITGRTCRSASDAATVQTLEIVKRYIREHPEEWDKHGAWLVETPLAKAFPCHKPN